MKNHPCRDCLLSGMCKQKSWNYLIKDCSIVYMHMFSNYVPGDSNMDIIKEKINQTFIELRPNRWEPSSEGNYWTRKIKE